MAHDRLSRWLRSQFDLVGAGLMVAFVVAMVSDQLWPLATYFVGVLAADLDHVRTADNGAASRPLESPTNGSPGETQ